MLAVVLTSVLAAAPGPQAVAVPSVHPITVPSIAVGDNADQGSKAPGRTKPWYPGQTEDDR